MSKNNIVITVADTKGGSTKSTTVANIGAFCALSGLKTLLIDFDCEQPSISSYYEFRNEASGGVFEFLVSFEKHLPNIVSNTYIPNLDVMASNSIRMELNSHLNAAADGVIRLSSCIKSIRSHYDVIIIDTVGTVDQTINMAVLASDIVLSPVEPAMQGAREYLRGTIYNLFKSLVPFTSFGLILPPIFTFFNKIELTNDCRRVKSMFSEQIEIINKEQYPHSFPVKITQLPCDIKYATSYKNAASLGQPAFCTYQETDSVEYLYRISKKQAQDVKNDIYNICINIMPQFKNKFDQFNKHKLADINSLIGSKE